MEDVVKSIGIVGVIVAASAWLLRELATHFLSGRLEQHKERLRADTQEAIEKLRHDAALRVIEHEVKTRRVDEKVAERLDVSYGLLFKLYAGVKRLVAVIEMSGGPTKAQLLEECIKANADFKEYFYPNRCYIPPAIYEHIKSVANKLVTIANDFATGLAYQKEGNRAMQSADYWMNSFRAVDKEATPLFDLMVAVVRKRIGVEDTDAELALLDKLPPISIKTDE